MPTARPSPLSTEQVAALRADLGRGETPMVWFTPAAVGMAAGRSAKVIALGDPAEGDFIQVRPTGSKDVLSFSVNELTTDKPARQRKPAAPARPRPEPERQPATDELLVVRERPQRRPTRPARTEQPASTEPATPARPQAKSGRQRGGRTRPPAPVTVTLSSTQDGEWTVEVTSGGRRAVKAQPVPAASVASAAKALGGDIEAAIEGVLTAAREQQRARVAQLEAELAAARAALAELVE